MAGGLLQILSYPRKYFICDVEFLTLGRVYNTFKVINPYDDAFSKATIIPNFYDDTKDTFF
jgi:hypothetical protein